MSGPGGWSPVKSVTPEMNEFCLDVKSDIEKMARTAYGVYTPVSFAYQITKEPKINYLVKVDVGDVCVHAMISVDPPFYKVKLTVLRVLYPKASSEPLVPF